MFVILSTAARGMRRVPEYLTRAYYYRKEEIEGPTTPAGQGTAGLGWEVRDSNL